MPKKIDIVGNKYGLLTVLEDSGENIIKKLPKDNVNDIEELKENNYLNKMDKYFNIFYSKRETIIDYLKDDYLIFLDEIGNLKTKESLERVSKKPKACSTECQNGIKINDIFNYLTVIDIISMTGQETQYKCKCKCGNIVVTQGYKLKNGSIKSCGCYRKERMSIIGINNSETVDLTEQKFGNLIALEPTEKRQGRSIIWKCQCNCGNIHYASASNLKGNSVTRCNNCTILSKGEEKIKSLLDKMSIPFSSQQTFDSCRSPVTNTLLRFDFYVNNQYLIEFDGKQHFIESDFFNSTLKDIQLRDNYKNNWCIEHNIPLIRIPYTHLSSLKEEDLILETSKYLIF